MDFKSAITALDGDGINAIKRPAMLGYVYCTARQEATEDTPAALVLAIRQRDGKEVSLTIEDRTRRVLAFDGGLEWTAETLEAFAIANDWEVSPRAELEKARLGQGTM